MYWFQSWASNLGQTTAYLYAVNSEKGLLFVPPYFPEAPKSLCHGHGVTSHLITKTNFCLLVCNLLCRSQSTVYSPIVTVGIFQINLSIRCLGQVAYKSTYIDLYRHI